MSLHSVLFKMDRIPKIFNLQSKIFNHLKIPKRSRYNCYSTKYTKIIHKELLRQFLKHQMEYENKNTDGNSTVGDVKGRPVEIAEVKVKKVDNISKSDPVDQISDGAAKYQGKPGGKKRLVVGCIFIKI